jgi:glucokinase
MDLCGGIDVGGTKIASALFTPAGEISARDKIAIDKAGGDAAAGQVASRIEALAEAARAAGGRLLAVGISVPGIAYSASGKVWAPNIPGWDQYPLLERIRSDPRFREIPSRYPSPPREGMPEMGDGPRAGGHLVGLSVQEKRGLPPTGIISLVLESDRSAYVAGEAWRGAAAGARDAVFLAVGTGIGAGIISGGRVLHGHEDIAGAVGWFGLDPVFKPDYAAMGSFEAEASGTSVARKARARLEQGRPSVMRDLAGGDLASVTAEVVAEAARRGDPAALEVVAEAVTYLAMGVANIVSILNPEVVVLGGGLFQAADIYLEPVRREFRRWAQPLAARAVRIEPSALGEDAGLFGCGRLAWQFIQERGHVPEGHVPGEK